MSLLTSLHKLLKPRGRGTEDTAVSAAAGTRRSREPWGSNVGFTITEALATVIIVGLVTAILAGGIGLATSQYTKSMRSSESQMLYSSLQKILDTELRFTKTYAADASGNITGFESKHYKAKEIDQGGIAVKKETSALCTVPVGGDGKTANEPTTPGMLGMASAIGQGVVTNTFLGSGAYNYGLEACVKSLTYDAAGRCFKVRLAITQGSDDANPLIDETFTVRALNNPQSGS